VDEAHHLEWSEEEASSAYRAVESIAHRSAGLLLLTATPEQLGRDGHFARLRLLDPDRFHSLAEFQKESERYGRISRLADRVLSKESLSASETEELRALFVQETLPETSEGIVAALLDAHGTGRVIFRNRRTVLKEFAPRRSHLIALPHQAKIEWLAGLLQERPLDKFLLIGSTKEMALQIEEELRQTLNIDSALFHEDLTLIQRDRNAAWFADEDGARILICSEIGSEGRNFQFAHHLVLFDLPPNPGLLEQRIGRLDRIGQSSTIHIHIPYIEGTTEELYARWYEEGLNAFEKTLHGSENIYRHFHPILSELGDEEWEAQWPSLLEQTLSIRNTVEEDLAKGRDHLLELSSFDAEEGEKLVNAVEELDDHPGLEDFMLQLFDHFGVSVEDLGSSVYLLKPENLFSPETFVGLPTDGLSITFDRDIATAREEIAFLSWDHPMVISAMDMLLASSRGNSGFVETGGKDGEGLLLDLTYILEVIAPPKRHVGRFLPPFPIRVIVSHEGKDCTSDFPPGSLKRARKGSKDWLRPRLPILKELIPKLLKSAEPLAEKAAKQARKKASDKMAKLLGNELERLARLKALGHPVRSDEIKLQEEEKDALTSALGAARLRLDSIRLIRLK
ncbi:MAG: helicase-related protein, partial [Verrucomicrobiota bacterium]